ncbi:hypothetical protein BH10BDE1_BH10BDE1_04800 [soil metagenome]
MARVKFVARWIVVALMTLIANHASALVLRYDKKTSHVHLQATANSITVEIPHALVLNHLMDSLRLYDWYFENTREDLKFSTYPNPLKLTVARAVVQRFETQRSRVRAAVAFLRKASLRPSTSKILDGLELKIGKLNASREAGGDIRSINDALFSVLVEFTSPSSRREYQSGDAPVLLILESYLRPRLDLGFVRPKGDASIEFMKAGVTQQQWFDVMGTNPSFFSRKENCPAEHRITRGVSICPSLPLETMSIHQVFDFVEKVSFADSKFRYELPTEAERSAVTGLITEASSWFVESSGQQTHKAGTRSPNKFGLFDMTGNLWEITRDGEAEGGVRGRMGAPEKFRIAGGSWIDRKQDVVKRASSIIPSSWTCYDVGFRLVRRPRE